MPDEKDAVLSELYRGFLKKELARPEIARAKQEFIASRFGESRKIIFHPAGLAPALCLAMLFLFFHHLMPEAPPQARPIPGTAPKTSSVPVVMRHPRVEVKRLSSDVGPTMVYQKMYQKTTVTIIWVFTGGY